MTRNMALSSDCVLLCMAFAWPFFFILLRLVRNGHFTVAFFVTALCNGLSLRTALTLRTDARTGMRTRRFSFAADQARGSGSCG
jgi:hypothetical protein